MRHPAVPFCLSLLAGAAVGLFVSIPADVLATAIWLGLVLACLCLSQGETVPYLVVFILTTALCGVTLGVVGMTRAMHPPLRAVLNDVRGPGAVSDSVSDPVMLTGVLAEDAAPGEEGARLALDLRFAQVDDTTLPVDGVVLLSVAGANQPPGALAWSKGRTIRVPALLRRPARYLDPGVPDHEVALLRRGVVLVGTVKSPLLVDVLHRGSWLSEAAAGARAAARTIIGRHVGRHSGRSAAIVRAILIGDRTGLDDETEDRMQAAGSYHVLAISGGNIAILAVVVIIVLRVLALRTPALETCAIVALTTYAWLVGGGASVTRATLMAVTVLAAHAIDHRTRAFNALAVAGGLGLAANPLTLFDPGTWLTYGASFAIVTASAATGSELAARPAWMRMTVGLIVASLAAELALFPVSAFVFSRVTAAGLLVNLAAIPLMSVVQVASMAMLALAFVSPGAAAVTGHIAHLAAWGLVESGRLVELAPWLTMRLPSPPWWAMAAYYGGWGVWLATSVVIAGSLDASVRSDVLRVSASTRTRLRHLRRGSAVMVVLAALWMLRAPEWGAMPPPGMLRVTFIDVGQGDATLVQCPNGMSLLVDAGGAGGGRFDIGGRVVAPVLWARGVRRLTYLVVTHGDGDHMNGAARLVPEFRPAEVWEGVPVPPHGPSAALRAVAQASGATWRNVQRGDRVALGDVDVLIRHPPMPDWERQRVRNDDSIVVEVRYRDVSVMLPGDVEATGERSLVPDLSPGLLRILQAPHHGSASSSSALFLEAAGPSAGIVSAGRGNRFGHPHRVVLDRFDAVPAPVFRTDRDGAITVELDGRTGRVSTYTGRTATLGVRPGPDSRR